MADTDQVMREDYVSFETAKLLKAAGYPQCKREEQYAGSKYTVDGELTHAPYAVHYAAPPLHRAMKWLRKVHNYFIQIELYSKYDNYTFEVFANTHRLICDECLVYNTYEEACDNAIRYTIEHYMKIKHK